jgi:hypothetical protein
MAARGGLLDLLLPALFLTTIATVCATTDWRGRSNWVAELEMRPPALMPGRPHSREALESWLDRFGKFFTDHFGLRQTLVDWEGRIQIGLLRRSPSPQVLVGDHGFLFYTGQRSFEDHRHLDQFTEAELDHWAAGLKERHDWLAARGTPYLFVIGPNKNSVYAENVPSTVHVQSGRPRVQQIQQRIGDAPYFLDLTLTLRAARDKGMLYFRKDSHWNDLGAQTAFRAIMERLNLPLPAGVGDEPKIEHPDYIPDLSRLSGVSIREPATGRTPICGRAKPTSTDSAMYGPGDPAYAYPATDCEKAQGELLIFHDSFAGAMVPYLADSFRRVVFVRRMPNFEQFKQAVEVEKPSVVIEERVERLLMFPLAE